MSRESIRIALATQIAAMQAAWLVAKGTPLVVEVDNRKMVDQATQSKPYLQVELRFMSAEQADLSHNPMVRHDGQLLLAAVAKDNSGMAAANELLDFARPYFELQYIGPMQCQVMQDYPGKSKLGWYYSPAIVNFWYHRLSA